MLLLPAALAGVAGGAGFFGGLWWTIQRGLRSDHAALWFVGSTLLRTAAVLVLFAWISHGDLGRALACVGGFVAARIALQILGRSARPAHPPDKAFVRGSP